MQLEEISELLNMLSALVPLAPTLLMKRQIAAIALSLLLVAIDLGTYVKPPLIPVNNQSRDRQLNSFSDEDSGYLDRATFTTEFYYGQWVKGGRRVCISLFSV